MDLDSKIKNLILALLLILFAVSCGENGGDAPGGSCAGEVVGGACWYLGADGDTCTDVCANHGGYNAATNTYAGSGGSAANCLEVANAINMPGSSITDAGCGTGLACVYDGVIMGRFRCSSPTTIENTGGSQIFRACACNE